MKYVFPKILIGVFPFIVSDRQKSSAIGLLFCKVIHTPRLYIMVFDFILILTGEYIKGSHRIQIINGGVCRIS